VLKKDPFLELIMFLIHELLNCNSVTFFRNILLQVGQSPVTVAYFYLINVVESYKSNSTYVFLIVLRIHAFVFFSNAYIRRSSLGKFDLIHTKFGCKNSSWHVFDNFEYTEHLAVLLSFVRFSAFCMYCL